MQISDCKVYLNCKHIHRMECWICENYSLYQPEDKKILSPFQEQKRLEKAQAKKELKASDASKRGKRAKKKGYEGENEVVKLLNKWGLDAERVPLSGALKTEEYSGDVKFIVRNETKRAEVKRRKSGFKQLYDFLNQDKNTSFLFCREDYGEWLVIMNINEFIELAKGGEEIGTE